MTAALAHSASAPTPLLTLVDPEVPASELSVEDLGSRIVGLAGRLAAATCQWLLLVAAFDARDGCARFGLASTARWLTHCCGLSHRAAVDHVRVARALAGFPDLASAMSSGRISYSHARAISRVAKEGETRMVNDLIEIAESGTVGQVEIVVRSLRTIDDAESADDPESADRPGAQRHSVPEEYLRTGWASNSQWQLTARLDPERGALVQSSIEKVAAAEGITQVEALERIAEVALVVLEDAGRMPGLRGDERAAIVVHLDTTAARAALGPRSVGRDDPAGDVDVAVAGTSAASVGGVDEVSHVAAARNEDAASGLPTAHLDNGPGLSSAVVERLLCEGRIRTSLHNVDGSMFDLGRSRRVVSPRLFRALLDRDRGCAHPGCHSRSGLEAHHVRHWIFGGPTDLANLVLLCRRHHHTHHDGEFSIAVAADGGFVFRRADGRVLEPHVDPGRLMGSAPELEVVGAITEPRWTGTGQRLDRHWAAAVLAGRRYELREAG